MSSDLIRCCLCLVDYDLEKHIPVMLSHCGHNTCQLCADSILKSHHRECPICRKSFPKAADYTMYVPNRQIKERLEREGEYQSCKVHEGRLLEFYCKTDKCKVCIDCCFDKGEQSHKGHDVERIADLKEEIDTKRKVFEEHLESCRMTNEEVKSLVEKKKQEFLYNNQETERVANLIALDTLLRMRVAFDEEAEKMNKICGEDSDIMKEIQAKVSEYKNIKNADINTLLEQNPEEFTKKLDNPKVQEYLQSLKNHIELPATPVVTQDSNKITINAPGALKVLKMNGCLRFDLNENELSITVSQVFNKNMTLDLAKCDQEVKKFKVVFDNSNFNEDDLQVITYLWTRFQPQVDTVDINYQNIQSFDNTLAQEHLVDFPRMIFSNPRALKSLGLSFVHVGEGIDVYLQFLNEKILPQSPNLTALSLTLINTELLSSEFDRLITSLNSDIKGITHLSLNFSPTKLGYLPLLRFPYLKNFKFATSLNHFFKRGYLNEALLSMKALEECDISLPNNSSDDLVALFSLFYSFAHLKALKINMHSVKMQKSDLDNLITPLKSHLKQLQAVDVDIQYTEPSRIGGGGLFANQNQVSSYVFGQSSNRNGLFPTSQSSSGVTTRNTNTVFSSNPFANQAQTQATLASNIPQPSHNLFNNNGSIANANSTIASMPSLVGVIGALRPNPSHPSQTGSDSDINRLIDFVLGERL